MVTEIKSVYENFNQSLNRESDEANESELEIESKETSDTLELPPKKKSEGRIQHVILSLHLCNDEKVKSQSHLMTSQVSLVHFF